MRGFSLIEVLVALVLVALVTGSVATVVVTQSRAALRIRGDAEAMESTRIVRRVLEGEVRYGIPGRDWQRPGLDTLALRAFRGFARVCGPGGAPDQLLVFFRGMRRADPAKDSLLVLTRDGAWTTRSVVSVEHAPDGCGPEGREGQSERWRLDAPSPDAIMLRLFERGSYHLAVGAFRYRIGGAGRQPLTPERIDHVSSRLTGDGATLNLLLILNSGDWGLHDRGAGGAAPTDADSSPLRARARIWPIDEVR